MTTKFDPALHDDNPPMDVAFLSGMKPSRRGRPKLDAPKVEVKVCGDSTMLKGPASEHSD
jgi:hypothetical protein